MPKFTPKGNFALNTAKLKNPELQTQARNRASTANKRIQQLVKNQNYYSPSLVKRYRDVKGLPKRASVSWDEVIAAASKGELNFKTPKAVRTGMHSIKYDRSALTDFYRDVTNFLNTKTSTKTGIREHLQQTKTNFGGLLTDPEFASVPEAEQTFVLREAFDIMDDLDAYLRQNGDSIDKGSSEYYKVVGAIAADIANGSPLRSSMTVSEFVEYLKDIAKSQLTVSMDAVNEEFFKDTGYRFEEW